MSSPGPDAPEPRRKARTSRRHVVGRVVLTSSVVLALVTALGVVFLYRHLNGNLNVQDLDQALGDDRPEEVYRGNGKPLDILVMGDDTRSGDNNDIDQETGGGSDTTILVHLSADRSRAYAISIPRDSIVTRPDCGEDDEIPGGTEMWNRAYALGNAADPNGGGAACAMRQVEATTGVRLEHYVVVDFNGFGNMVDAVDGVPVCVPEDIVDKKHGIFVPKGDPSVLTGDEALDYVRARYIGDLAQQNDLSRIKRQQAFIGSLIRKVKSAGTLSRLDRVVGFLDAATESLTIDPGLGSITRIGKLAMQLQGVGLDKVQFVTVPTEYFPTDSDLAGKVHWTEEADVLWELLREDKLLPASLLSQGTNAEAPSTSSEATETPSPTTGESGSQTPSPTETPTETSSPTETPSPTDTASPSQPSAPTSTPTTKEDTPGVCA
ncbi:LCP family protein [Nocardioides currus]|uniref:LytR family transcriptional regulator n=1 Tax=Nocardioides currus TaxID=2133958 RepID=A0A2R7Z1N4_9ACTN|nr:LCP family protein [Nocardioides currus]PUA82520.1 LytR family transcriptional regulator [Nocardioides currus]